MSCDRLTKVNVFGKKLLSLCKAFNFKVANGQCPGDFLGNCTCHTKTGSSVVDLVIVDEDNFSW